MLSVPENGRRVLFRREGDEMRELGRVEEKGAVRMVRVRIRGGQITDVYVSALMVSAAPALASSSAMARPILRALPVTMATLPASSLSVSVIF